MMFTCNLCSVVITRKGDLTHDFMSYHLLSLAPLGIKLMRKDSLFVHQCRKHWNQYLPLLVSMLTKDQYTTTSNHQNHPSNPTTSKSYQEDVPTLLCIPLSRQILISPSPTLWIIQCDIDDHMMYTVSTVNDHCCFKRLPTSCEILIQYVHTQFPLF